MLKIKVIRNRKYSTILKRGETGTYKIEDIYVKIGKNKHYLCEIEHFKEWNKYAMTKIDNKRRYSESKTELKNKLYNILKEYTDKTIKEIDDIFWNIITGYSYYKRGSKNYEGIKVVH